MLCNSRRIKRLGICKEMFCRNQILHEKLWTDLTMTFQHFCCYPLTCQNTFHKERHRTLSILMSCDPLIKTTEESWVIFARKQPNPINIEHLILNSYVCALPPPAQWGPKIRNGEVDLCGLSWCDPCSWKRHTQHIQDVIEESYYSLWKNYL